MNLKIWRVEKSSLTRRRRASISTACESRFSVDFPLPLLYFFIHFSIILSVGTTSPARTLYYFFPAIFRKCHGNLAITLQYSGACPAQILNFPSCRPGWLTEMKKWIFCCLLPGPLFQQSCAFSHLPLTNLTNSLIIPSVHLRKCPSSMQTLPGCAIPTSSAHLALTICSAHQFYTYCLMSSH